LEEEDVGVAVILNDEEKVSFELKGKRWEGGGREERGKERTRSSHERG